MRITAELSLYPMEPTPVGRILDFVHQVRAVEQVEVLVNQMSTQIRGELDDVIRAVQEAMRESFEKGGQQALIVKFLNSDLPIDEAPDLGSSR